MARPKDYCEICGEELEGSSHYHCINCGELCSSMGHYDIKTNSYSCQKVSLKETRTMSMYTHVVGFKPPDEKWKKMKAAWDACHAAGVDPPENVEKFFNSEPPDEAGVEVREEDLKILGAITKYDAEMYDGFEVHIDKLPKDVKIIRFYNSY